MMKRLLDSHCSIVYCTLGRVALNPACLGRSLYVYKENYVGMDHCQISYLSY